MASTIGWLDTDSEERRKMMEVVELFRESGTVDELGTGSIRDTISDALFPGTSILHGRLRYVLFIPWLLQRAAHKPTPPQMSVEFRNLEIRLISSLEEGGETLFVIGIAARSTLKRTPSVLHWSALSGWGILSSNLSPDAYFRRQADYRALVARTAAPDDLEARESLPGTGIDPHLPSAPDDLLKSVRFDLTAEEESYLSDRLTESAAGSLLAWLINNPPGNRPDSVWNLDNLRDAPERLAELIDHGRRFQTAIFGAPLLYNLMLAEASDDDDRVDQYRKRLADWQDEIAATAVLDHWDRRSWWRMLRFYNPRLRRLTSAFVDSWLTRIDRDANVADSGETRSLIRRRERQIKGGRARLVNQAALDRWSGASGVIRYDYRWPIARRHLDDLYAARSRS
ncbi:MAG TPA: DUF6361 family protein [Microlunatus sp.]